MRDKELFIKEKIAIMSGIEKSRFNIYEGGGLQSFYYRNRVK
ncbi:MULTISPECIES: hypothetical protein [Bacillus cereus group]|nr:hypothetical protein [Bacillus cereus]